MNSLVDKIKNNNPDLDESEILGILWILKNKPGLSNNDLVTYTGLPKETLKKFKQSIPELLSDLEGDNVVLSTEGEKLLKSTDIECHKWSLADIVDFSNEDKEYIEEIKLIKSKYSAKPKRDYDQFLATPESTFLKSKILVEKGLVNQKSMAFIGDDDLNSISLAVINKNYKNIVVFEIDDEIITNIKKACVDLNIDNLIVEKYDARKDIENKYFGKFDTVVFDPPYTKSGVTLFLQRATDLLGKIRDFDRKFVVMYYGNSFKSPEKNLKIQEVIGNFGFSIEDRIEKFARYSGAESIGNASSLYILKANKFTRGLGGVSENIYTYEKTSEEKFPFVDHVVFKVYEVKKEISLSKKRMLDVTENICKRHRLKVVDKKMTDFKGGGMTISFILANSNLTIHTWPELNAVHIDLITCSPIFNKDGLYTSISELFDTLKVECFYIE